MGGERELRVDEGRCPRKAQSKIIQESASGLVRMPLVGYM